MKAIYENHYLTDKDVANYARQSFATLADQFTESQNNNLIRFLARGMASGDWESLIDQLLDLGKTDYAAPLGSTMEANNRQKAKDLATYCRKIPEHWVPFGHPHISLRMSAPIPIRVQCFKHKVGFVESEESRRYISSRPALYVPDAFRSAAASVKQGSAGVHPDNANWLQRYGVVTAKALQCYEDMTSGGVCPEQARFVLPQGCEVNWIWTGSLYAFANVFNLRTDSHAQKEVQDLAHQIGEIIEPLYPVSWTALTQGAY